MRVAFVGQRIYFEQCALTQRSGDTEAVYVDFRAGASAERLIAELTELDPEVILVFRPEIIPAGLFDPLRALTIGYLTEPLPRDPRSTHEDLRARLWWLEQVDPDNFDRVLSFDPLIAETAGAVLPVWRSLPLPVADEMFLDVRERSLPPRLLFVGRSTEHREQMLAPIKARHPIVHIGHGLFGPPLLRFLQAADVQLNIHNNPYPSFENRVCIALAAGHLVISEPLSPANGLRAGEHYLEAERPEQFAAFVEEVTRDPLAYREVQEAGRAAAERFRASTVYPELFRAAQLDVERSGSGRRERRAARVAG